MDFKISINCLRCGCSFELRPTEDANTSEHIFCPNCGQNVPTDIARHLKNGMRELSLVPFSYAPDDECALFNGFSFSLKEHHVID